MIPLLLAIPADSLDPQNTTANSTPIIAQSANVASEAKGPNSFPYASLQLGVGFPVDFKGSTGEPNLGGINYDLNSGFNGEAAFGYKFNNVRAEVGIGYGNYGVDKLTALGGLATLPVNGSVEMTTVMLNGYYDIPIHKKDGRESRWSPYIGAGIGYANVQIPRCSDVCGFGGGSTDGLAYQGKLGLSYRIAERSFAFLEGGYLGATSGSSIDGVDFDDFGTWRLNVGFRIGFGGASKTKPVAKVQEVQPQPVIITPETMPAPAAKPAIPIRGLW